ncbi:MAG: Y-family DNA polymerase [Bacteroidales bacterium]|nr:Y-family DNA polymerase [Bacteroidales bacterium]
MDNIFALIDCNNFYASCEKIFNPSLEGKPVVVLSNNDGCVISRSEEAKAIGIKMGIPVFEIPDLIEKHKVHVFSTNYALYGDISQRVMNTLSRFCEQMEIYSIDEAFLDLSGFDIEKLAQFGNRIKSTVMKWTGIPVSVGIAPTKILAKLANHTAKTRPELNGVLNLMNHKEPDEILRSTNLSDIWGIGEKYEAFFSRNNINHAYDLKISDENRVKEHLGVMGQRIVLELRGKVCYPLNKNPDTKKEICTSRSFGHPIETYEELEQATTSYVSKVAQKLRKQNSLAQSLLIFIMTNKYASGPQYVNYKIIRFSNPTNNTQELLHYAVLALKALYKKGYKYKKSGVIVSDVIPQMGMQVDLWSNKNRAKLDKISKLIDDINNKAGMEKIKFAIQGTENGWKMRQHNLSPHYTTRWSDILQVDADEIYKNNSED